MGGFHEQIQHDEPEHEQQRDEREGRRHQDAASRLRLPHLLLQLQDLQFPHHQTVGLVIGALKLPIISERRDLSVRRPLDYAQHRSTLLLLRRTRVRLLPNSLEDRELIRVSLSRLPRPTKWT